MLALASLLLLSCQPAEVEQRGLSGDSASDDTAGGDAGGDAGDAGDGGDEGGLEPAPLAELSEGSCPDLTSSGTKQFESAGYTRDVIVYFPEDPPADLPVVFIWHPLGASASQMASWLDLEQWAEEYQAVIVVPDSRDDNLLEWDFWNEDEYDLIMYDDLRTCLSQELAVDLKRISTFGFSAGALWTSRLSMERGDTFASAVVASGGCELELPTGGAYVDCLPPEYPFPALTLWGGENDTYGFGGLYVYFADSMESYRELLMENGHYVVSCNHEMGHTIPNSMITPIAEWLTDHTYGEESPYIDAGIGGFPSYCWVE